MAGVVAACREATAVAAAPPVSPAPAPASQNAPQEVKYYVVPPPVNGKTESLFEIATKTLRDRNRYAEIIALNNSRLQPDGQRLESPDVLETGWILQLPEDASGPGVNVGPLPAVTLEANGGDGAAGVPSSPRDGSGNPILLLIGGASVAVLLAGAGIVFALVGGKPRGPRRARHRAVRPTKPPKQPKSPKTLKQPKPPIQGKEPKQPKQRQARESQQSRQRVQRPPASRGTGLEPKVYRRSGGRPSQTTDEVVPTADPDRDALDHVLH